MELIDSLQLFYSWQITKITCLFGEISMETRSFADCQYGMEEMFRENPMRVISTKSRR